jgi:hypothetical protein
VLPFTLSFAPWREATRCTLKQRLGNAKTSAFSLRIALRMKLLDQLQRRFGRLAVPHVTEGLIACQVLTYFAAMSQPQFVAKIQLLPSRVLQGEIWRLVTFLGQPPPVSVIFVLFFWYLFYLMGVALEGTWGTFRYNVFLLTGYVATVSVSFLQPNAPASIAFLQGSIFLAFAYLYPDFEILLFFILPVKVKWLALLQGIWYGGQILFADWPVRLMVAASICNFALFFWHDIYLRMRAGRRRMAGQAAQIQAAHRPRHTCVICGANNLSQPKMSFRYCSKCAGGPCYCAEHIHDHAHVLEEKEKE